MSCYFQRKSYFYCKLKIAELIGQHIGEKSKIKTLLKSSFKRAPKQKYFVHENCDSVAVVNLANLDFQTTNPLLSNVAQRCIMTTVVQSGLKWLQLHYRDFFATDFQYRKKAQRKEILGSRRAIARNRESRAESSKIQRRKEVEKRGLLQL